MVAAIRALTELLLHSDAVATTDDIAAVAAMIGRPPQADFDVVVRGADAMPVVIRNAPFLHDGTPMPTRYWLVDPELTFAISRLESAGAVKQLDAELDPLAVQAAHDRYAAERDAAISVAHVGARPSGGVAGTARGLKCLHAHYAHWLVTHDDVVGERVHEMLQHSGGAPVTETEIA